MAKIQITDSHGTTTFKTDGNATIRLTDYGFEIIAAAIEPTVYDNSAFFAAIAKTGE